MLNKPASRPARSFSVAVHFLRMLTDYVEERGLSMERLLLRAGISPDAIEDPNGRVPYQNYKLLCEVASVMLEEPCLGLQLGQSVKLGHLGSQGVAVMSCSNGAELMRQHTRYSALAIDVAHYEFERSGHEYIRYWRSNLPGGEPVGRLQDELIQSIGVTVWRWLYSRGDVRPNWVSFQHARPDDIRPYEAIFPCPVRFGAPATAMAFNAEILDLKLPQANPQLHRVLETYCGQLLRQLGSSIEPQWLALARKSVVESLELGEPDLAVVARAAGLEEAELRARFGERGLSFRGLVDATRQALAESYMKDPRLEIVDVAYLLGFSEQSAFQRAFKRWTGVTPGNYRRNSLDLGACRRNQ